MRQLAKTLSVVMVSTLTIMTLFEMSKQLVHPDITLLQSHVLTVLFSTLIGTVVAGYALMKYKKINQTLAEQILERERIEEELRASEQKFSQFFMGVPVALGVVNSEGVITYFNERFTQVFGYTTDDIPTINDWWQRAYPDESYRQRVMDSWGVAAAKAAKEGGDIKLAGYKVTCKDGVERLTEIGGFVFEDNLLATFVDVTARKQAEEAMERIGRDLAIILESAGEGICTMDLNGNHVLVNPSAARMFGYAVEEVIGRHSHSLWHYAKADGSPYPAKECPIYATLRDGVVRRSDSEVFWRKDGYSFPVEYVCTPIRSNDLITGVVVVFHDITERKQAAQALEASELKFRTILDSAVDGILVADGLSHKFVTANRAICDMLGYPLEEMYRLGMEDIHPAEKLAEVQKGFERQLKGEIRMAINLPVKRKDGSVFFADVSASPMVLAGRTFLVGIFHDVTEREVMEREIRTLNGELETKVRERTQQLLAAQETLVRNEKLAVLGQIAGSVGHELRNPLGVMSNAVYFLQTVLSDADETTREYLNIIKDEIAGSERIVSDLLDSVRTKPPHPERVGVAELIAQTLRKYIMPSSVVVKLDIPETLPAIRVDAMQIQQVLRNLISNGVEAMPEGGTLQISAVADKAENNITVSVRDSGIGMTAEQLGHLFQPLFTTKARGIGLGLVVVKNLTEANGGSVEVQSQSGKGTTFSITLPGDNSGGATV